MRERAFIFSLRRDVAVTDLAARLAPPGRHRVHGPLRGLRQWLDSFDWRLVDAGLVLEHESAGRDARLRLLAADGSAVPLEVRAPARPVFLDDLPTAALRRRLARALGVRSLLVRAEQAGTLHEIRVLDARDKTVARVDVWRPARRGPCFARVVALRGFERDAARLARRLSAQPEAQALAGDPLRCQAMVTGCPPGRYPGWKVDGMAADLRTDDALRLVLSHYREVMALNVPGMRDDLDSEFLHDFRVGLRRSRALLRRVHGVFAPARLAPFLDDLAWLSEVTGPARDADVHCLVFPTYAQALGDDAQVHLAPLMVRVEEQRVQAHRALVQALDSPRFARRWPAWRRFLDTPSPRGSRQPNGAAPVATVASAAILKAARRVRRQGRRIGDGSPASAYHKHRKSCKNLRYLIDAFHESLSNPVLEKATSRLKKLQDVLGEHQDLDVHRAALQALHAELAEEGALGGETDRAMERLMAELAVRSVATRARFARQFRRFLSVRLEHALDAGDP